MTTLAATVGLVRPLFANDPQSLLDAIAAGNLQSVREVLARGVSPDATDRFGRTALMLAADRGDRQVVAALLDQGATVDARTPAGDTALMVAAFRGFVEVVRLLLERGADPNAANVDGWTAVTFAQHTQRHAIVALLLGETPPDARPRSRGATFGGAPPPPTAPPTVETTALTPLQAQVSAIQLEPVLSGLSSPLYVTHARDQSNRLFIVEQPGRILVLQPGASTPTVFLDITASVLSGGERGLLGLAFHPSYATNRRFFVNYTSQAIGGRPLGATVIAEYRASSGNPNVADPSETELLVISQPFDNHNGGMIEFGPDGFLYIGMGDGGSGNDPGNRAQNLTPVAGNEQFLGKFLRIDVATTPYSSPSDNPFFGGTSGDDEIYALGFRNPFRFSFDRETGVLVAGDVGQGEREEIDVVALGGNYGWRVFEGTRCTGNDPGLCSSTFVNPIAEYDHSGGSCSITGGYVYRGARGTLPQGTYVFGDFCTGQIMQLESVTSGAQEMVLLDTELNISSFGEDQDGEIYVVGLQQGTVQRIAAASSQPGGSSDGGGGGCFIATAAFGSPLAREVETLRAFRDRYLVTNAPGRMFIAGYYWVSPPVADLIRQHDVLRAATRLVLRPTIWGARLTETSPASMLVLLVAIAGSGGFLWYGWRSRRLRFTS